jgi:leucyl aminopeptidase (aminopeptidase T)
MEWIEKDRIREGVINMFRVNMGVREGERLLVVTDLPQREAWQQRDSAQLSQILKRSMLAKMASEVARESFPQCAVDFFPFPMVARSGAEPGEEVAQRMREADVVIAITNHSLSHTDARVEACQAGARIASMPGFLAEMFYAGGPMAADYERVADETRPLARMLSQAQEAIVRSRAGTDMGFSLAGREGGADTGLFREKGSFGNLPAGEAYIAPLEGTGNGQIVVEEGWFRGLEEKLVLRFEDGLVRSVQGGGEVGEMLLDLLGLGKEGADGGQSSEYEARRNLAELGVGTNPNAHSAASVLEAEKIRGTVHMAIGDNAHIGGIVSADLHWDFVIPRADLILDRKTIMRDGEPLL